MPSRENATIHDAYTQLTVRYVRAIPELLKYNALLPFAMVQAINTVLYLLHMTIFILGERLTITTKKLTA